MATRFKLTDDATAPDISPALQTYTHTQTTRRVLLTTDASALATEAFTPDAADHLVAGDSHHVQFVSAKMAAGNVFTSGDTLKMALQCLEANAANNLFLQVFVSVVSGDGATVQATLRTKAADNTEMATVLTNRFHSTTLSAGYTTVADDRLVVEFSCNGTPTAAGGVQGHNCSIRWGGGGAGGDLAEDDTSTGTTLNPWIEFLTTITFAPTAAPEVAHVFPDRLPYRMPHRPELLSWSSQPNIAMFTTGTVLRPPLVTRIVAVWPHAAVVSQPMLDLLGTTLGVTVAQAPFAQYSWPMPNAPAALTRTWASWYPLSLIGQDALPERQTDWPNPQTPRPAHQAHQDWYKLSLIGQDALPFRQSDWPVPKVNPPSMELRSWLQSSLNLLLQIIQLKPFAQLDWPNPLRVEWRIREQGWIQGAFIALSAIIVRPFAQFDWPLGPRRQHRDQSMAQGFPPTLIGQDLLPFRQSDWPLPMRRPVERQSWQQMFTNLLVAPVVGTLGRLFSTDFALFGLFAQAFALIGLRTAERGLERVESRDQASYIIQATDRLVTDEEELEH